MEPAPQHRALGKKHALDFAGMKVGAGEAGDGGNQHDLRRMSSHRKISNRDHRPATPSAQLGGLPVALNGRA